MENPRLLYNADYLTERWYVDMLNREQLAWICHDPGDLGLLLFTLMEEIKRLRAKLEERDDNDGA